MTRAPESSIPAPDTRQIAWLIERKFAADGLQPAETRWYAENALGFHWWTPTAHMATRFASKAEAKAFPAYQMIASDPTISVTEHVFIDRASLTVGTEPSPLAQDILSIVEGVEAARRNDRKTAERIEAHLSATPPQEPSVQKPVTIEGLQATIRLLRLSLAQANKERDLWKGRCEDSCEAMDRAISDMLERGHD